MLFLICESDYLYMVQTQNKPGSDTNKIMSHPASKNTEYGYVKMASSYSRRGKSLL